MRKLSPRGGKHLAQGQKLVNGKADTRNLTSNTVYFLYLHAGSSDNLGFSLDSSIFFQVTLIKLYNFSKSHFSHLQNGVNSVP